MILAGNLRRMPYFRYININTKALSKDALNYFNIFFPLLLRVSKLFNYLINKGDKPYAHTTMQEYCTNAWNVFSMQ